MGNWYTNVSLKEVQQSDVLGVLKELGRKAYVTPIVAGWVTVYDQQTDRFDLGDLESLALTLSMRLSCLALAACNADDDVLWLGLYENGALVTRYGSTRSAFEDGNEFPNLKDVTTALVNMSGRPEVRSRVWRVLRKRHSILGLLNLIFRTRLAYLFEIQRHFDLTGLLGMPRTAVGLGYGYVDRGDTPEGIDRETLKRT